MADHSAAISAQTISAKGRTFAMLRQAIPLQGQVRPGLIVLLSLLWGIILCVNAPGHLSYDSVVQLAEGRTGEYGGGHPPLMSALLGVFDGIVPGTGLYLGFVSALFLCAMALIVMRSRNAVIAGAAIAAIFLNPFILIYQGIVWKDVLFANLALLAFSCLLLAADGAPRKARWPAFALAAMLAALASLVRQNGFVIVPFVLASVFWLEREACLNVAGKRTARAAGVTASAVVVIVATSLVASHVVDRTASGEIGDTFDFGFKMVAFYDIGGILARSPTFQLGSVDKQIDAHLLRSEVHRLYSPERIDYLARSEIVASAFNSLGHDEFKTLWQAAILSDPLAYVIHRVAVFRWMTFPPDISFCLPVQVGVVELKYVQPLLLDFGVKLGDPEDLMRMLSLEGGLRPGDRALSTYALTFVGTPVFMNGAYALLAAALMLIFVIRRQPRDIPMALMLLAALAFSGTYLLIGIACDLRYMYFLPLATMAGLVYAATRVRLGGDKPQHPA